jgi:hypothetical protein
LLPGSRVVEIPVGGHTGEPEAGVEAIRAQNNDETPVIEIIDPSRKRRLAPFCR